MKLQHLRYLTATAAAGSIRGAARALGVSQASVTQGLRELEESAQLALLARHGRGAVFTAAGQDLLHHAQRILAQCGQAEDMLSSYRQARHAERLSIAITPWVAQTLLPSVIQAFRQAMPHVQLELFDGLSAVAYPRLREGSLDLVIGRIAPPDALQGLQTTPLFNYDMTVVARRGHPRAHAQHVAELMDDDWILNYTPHEKTALLDNLFNQHGLEPPLPRIHLAQSALMALTLVQQTDMLTLCPWPLVETDLMRSHLVALQLQEHFRTHTVGILRRQQETLTPSARQFLALFLNAVHAWPQSGDPRLRRVLHSVDVVQLAP